MSKFITKLPFPVSGLMLALAAIGNLVLPYGEIFKGICGILAAIILILLLIKIANNPKGLIVSLQDPLIASVFPTLTMTIMLLAVYIIPIAPMVALVI